MIAVVPRYMCQSISQSGTMIRVCVLDAGKQRKSKQGIKRGKVIRVKWSEMTNDEKDELVAIKVMGWEENDELGGLINPLVEQPKEPGVVIISLPPNYTIDIRFAWEVAEKMAQDWYDFGIQADKDTEGEWIVMWGYDGHGWETVTAATAPEAICHAALLAAGVEFEPREADKK